MWTYVENDPSGQEFDVSVYISGQNRNVNILKAVVVYWKYNFFAVAWIIRLVFVSFNIDRNV